MKQLMGEASSPSRTSLQSFFPVLKQSSGYKPRDYATDMLAGLVIWKTVRPDVYLLSVAENNENAYKRAAQPEALYTEELIIRIDGPVYFANVNYVEEQLINMLADKPGVKRVVIDAAGIPSIDLSGDHLLWEFLKTLILKDCTLAIAGVTRPVAELMDKSGFRDFLEPQFFFTSVPEAVAWLREE